MAKKDFSCSKATFRARKEADEMNKVNELKKSISDDEDINLTTLRIMLADEKKEISKLETQFKNEMR